MKVLRDNKRKSYTYSDVSNRPITKGEVYDEDCLNQSITNILSTAFGERIFNIGFGSKLPTTVFDTMTTDKGNLLVEDIYRALTNYEDRIFVVKDSMTFRWDPDNNTLKIDIPYIVLKNNTLQNYSRSINL